MSASQRTVLVIGGGFSGMAAAIECAKVGLAVELVEIDPGWRSYGAGISLGGATLRAFERLGILEPFLAKGFASEGVDLLTPHGHPIARLPTPRAVGASEHVPGGGSIMRPVLAKIMAEATRAAGVTVRLGSTFTAIAQDADGVSVDYTDGSHGRYDVVVGSDGLYSKLRELVFPEAPKPKYTGQGVWRAVVPRAPEIERITMWMGGATKPGANPVSATEMYIFVTEHRASNEFVAAEQQPEMLRQLLAPFSAPVLQRVAAQIDENAQVIYRPLENMLLPKPWFKGRVGLIGDAVHATTPHLASGACIGIEDGLVIGEELGRGGSVEDAWIRFQDRRYERCRMVVESSSRLGEIEITNGSKEEHGDIMRTAQMALAQPI